MVDLRYHVASIAGVFLALAVGVLLGVAISGQLSSAEESLSAKQLVELRHRLGRANARADGAVEREEAARQLMDKAYPALMEGRLAGRRIAVLFLGPTDGSIRSSVERTLEDAGAEEIWLIALDLPLDARRLARLASREELSALIRGADLEFLGNGLAAELVAGGETPLWDAVTSTLVEERSGSAGLRVDAVVAARSWVPRSRKADRQEERRTAGPVQASLSLVDGLLAGLDRTGAPIVGVEESDVEAQSAIDFYRENGLSSVDDVDLGQGRLALALLLAGGEQGHYGVKESASDGVSPSVTPVTPADGRGR